MDSSSQLRMMVYASLFAALTAVGAFMAIPIGPVPIVLQNMFVFLAGLLLGSRWGLASVGVYLLAGACGLPVFAGGLGGIGRIVGPTGGYLIGYLPTVFLIGKISNRAHPRVLFDVLAMICGSVALYACGIAWLKILTGMTVAKAVAVGMAPFLIGDALKIAAAAAIARALRPVVRVSGTGTYLKKGNVEDAEEHADEYEIR
jgi:biotin transport system substrate-specific component